ncbi:peptide ABC transporter substrate-binding protein [Bacillus sonorensis]|nr:MULTISPECIES: peptide ABC transporter substrate-binding protein [Bacillus]MCZ0073358.1 peptide ABC transporter substrate-binding protein [Bacillus sonorensis]MCZ0091980.1 peptide ABC transporter substrate-binding protein [Bacillus sonorensis]MDR4955818.1 peptide ABC transporter substrate-binding protein [Bacillus sonorensis]MEC0340380.1 peptide ABC transporter substrate-binding protein [Bacillus sonorensis]MEC0426057.1 peptide ABC transporter substrate-binding protein [Bacillus sonorensis]
MKRGDLMKTWWSGLIVMVVSVMLFGCTANEQAGQNANADGKGKESNQEQVLKLNNENEPTSFDPPTGFNNVSWQALNNLMEGLTRLGADHEPEAASAEKWSISDDGKTYTFTIRGQAKWSNGDPLTAGDFEYAWKRLLDPKTGSSAAFLGYVIEGGEEFNNGKGSKDDVKVEALNDKTLKVTLTSPQKSFLSIVSNPAFFPVNQKVAEGNPKWHEEADTFVGNGPFKLTEWKHDESLAMEKSDTYWDKKTVKLDKVTWAMVNDRNTDYQMFQSGELDTAYVPAEMSEKLMGSDEVKVFDQAGLYFYRFNVKMEPFQNENIRKAFAMAVDQQELVDYVTKNGEKPARAFVSPGLKGSGGKDFREEGGDVVTFNADEAKKLLEKGMKEEHYKKLPEITLTYSTKPEHKKMAEAVQQQLKSVLNVNVKLANMEWNTFLEEQKALKFQFSQSSFLADYADPINFLESFQTDNSMNRTGWSSKEYDQLIKAAKHEADEGKRNELMHQAEKVLFEGMPIIPVYFYNQVHLEKENVKGIIRHPVGYIELKWAEKT